MANGSVTIQCLAQDTTNRLAAQLQQERSIVRASGIAHKPAEVFGWNTWTDVSDGNHGYILSIAGTPAVLFWFEPDIFNSASLHVPQVRMHWLLNSSDGWTAKERRELSQKLSSVLDSSEWELTSLRLLGNDASAFDLFQQAGFKIVLGNAWLYRWPLKLPRGRTRTRKVEFELKDLRRQPLTSQALGEAQNIAAESFFADRFSLDPRIDRERVRRRFLTIVENGLTGKIADYVMLANGEDGIEAFAFFGVSKPNSATPSYILAGKWFTLLVKRSLRAQGLGHLLIAESIRRLPAGKANWTSACALNNLGSLQIGHKLGFRVGAIAYDFHRWRAHSGI